jgi:cytochrome c oxidase assembly protein subunit 11
MTMTPNDISQGKRHRNVALASVALVFAMGGLSFAAVPLYDLFCRTTGFGGTTMRANAPANATGARSIDVRFDSNVSTGLNWSFRPEAETVRVLTGETKTVTYVLRNTGKVASTGIASFNVAPASAGGYFNKIQCFCFTEQTLQPGETREETVVFFVDPAIEQDREAAGISTITLSYTLFPVKSPAVPQASVGTGSNKL